jgi:hypothetical protein
MIFMKIYALIAVVSACSLITSCTTDDLNNQNIDSGSIETKDVFAYRTSDSLSTDTNPVKTSGRDD